MTIYRATVLDTPDDPFTGGRLRAEADAGLLVHDGMIVGRGQFAAVKAQHLGEEVVDLTDGVVLPGFVDTHVHFPQVRVIGGLGMSLLDWLEQCALPEEVRLADVTYATGVAEEFVRSLAAAGTTSALVFGSHFAPAVGVLFEAAARLGLRVTCGLVTSDGILREELLTTPDRAYAEGLALADRWHGTGRARYAVTPRFSLSCTDPMLAACGALHSDVEGSFFTSHLNENKQEISTVATLFGLRNYLETYDRHGLVGPRSVFAHNVYPTDRELRVMADRGATVAHCPTSNAALGNGLFPFRRHRAFGVHVALGTDVGAGNGFSLLKEGMQAYFSQQLPGRKRYPLAPRHLLYLATTAGARALDLNVGHLGVGMPFDAQWIRPAPGSTLDVVLRNARDDTDALAKLFALGTPGDVHKVWVEGVPVLGPTLLSAG
ncbi:guanine deaminase [Nocardioides speluncae]|uniref:guanine deaminase n=1 Tax=Nocardioides speluncae TaxID=2670337 RepID=UPI000D687FDF|nr:guanine deaminase [Nocardioides speluncae]